ncbi:MAG: Ig-like domain-containing protein, partial [Verrucomicrobiae bacterium]|nr:Ig-like domain-containing protein [Verrucomicrobiae bacterium]
VRGVVVGSDGATPISGAEVVLTFQAPVFSGQSVTAVSAADGRFAFDDVPVGDYRLTASSVSLASSLTAGIEAGGETDEVTLRLGDSGSVAGRLVRADGVTPVSGVDVLLTYASQSANPGRAFVRSGDDGAFQFTNIPVGNFDLEAVAIAFGGLVIQSGAVSGNGQTVELGTLRFDEDFPSVLAVTPPDTTEEVSTTAPIELLFSEALAADSVTTNGVFVRSVLTNEKAATTIELLETNGVARLVRLTPAVPLVSEQIHEVIVIAGNLVNGGGGVIASGPRDRVGRGLTATFVSRFKTADNDPPILLSLFPTNGAVQIDPRAVPRLSFNEALRPGGFVFKLTGPQGEVAGAGGVGVDGRVLSFVPSDLLQPNAQYTLTVSNVLDLAGNRAAGEPFTATFATLDTVGPTLAALRVGDGRSPVAGATVPIEALLQTPEPGVSVRFTQDFNPLGSATNEPFRVQATLPLSGTTTFRAIATDAYGNDGPFAELVVAVQANQPPTLVFTRVSPTTGPARSGSFVAVDVEAVDDSGIAELKAIVAGIGSGDLARTNATKLRVQGFVSAAASPGSQVQIFAEARDDIGQSSGQQVFTLEISDGTPPELAILSPTNNARLDPTRPLELAVRVTDNFTNATLSVAITGAVTNDQTVTLPLVSNQAATHVFVVPLDDLPQTGGTLFAQVTATDGVGNTATASSVYRLTDATFPTVRSIVPADAATHAAVLPFITVSFSEPLDTNTVTAASFTVTGPGGAKAAGNFRFTGTNNVVLWEPSRALAFGSEYTISLTSEITDSNGNPMDPFTSRFTVADFGIVQPTHGAPAVEGQILPVAAGGPNPAGVREVTYRLRGDAQVGTNASFNAAVSVPLLAELGGSQAQLDATARVYGANVARTGTATASSEYAGGAVGRIIDGNRNGNWGGGSVAHANNELHPWFEVDLGRITQIQRLGLYFRTDSSPEQSAVAVLAAREPFVASDFTGEELPETYLNGAVELFRTTNGFALGGIEISTTGIGRYLRVVHLGRSYLTLAELEAYDGPEPNLAANSAATQSSQYGGYAAQYAVDGDRNNFTHTLNGLHEYLELDLGGIRELGQVDVSMRRDCCLTRNRIAILVAEQPFVAGDFTAPELPATYANGAVEIYRTTVAYDENVRIPTTATGRYLRIVHLGQDYLSISEVEIYQGRSEVPLAPVIVQVYSRDADTDGDGVSNGDEIDQGSDPFRADEKPAIQFPGTIEIVQGVRTNLPVVATDGDGNLRTLAVSEHFGVGLFENQAEFWNHFTSIGNLSQAPFFQPPTYVTPFAQLSFPYNTAPWFPGVQAEYVAGRFTGRLQVPEAGNYTFYLDSDDGSRLSLDGAVVIDHDGLHSASERNASVTLGAGSHAFEVLYFNNGGPGQLIVSWQGPGFDKRLVAGSDFSRFETLQFAESGTTSVISLTNVAALQGTLSLRSAFTNDAQLRLVAEDADGLVTEKIVTVVTLPDLDGDGIPDRDDPDMDGDGLSNEEELLAGTDPRSADTDGDGAPDNTDRNPLVANRIPVAGAGGAFRFDGVDDLLDAGSPEPLRQTGDQTIEFWIWPEITTRDQTLIAKAYAGEGGMALLSNGQIRYHYGNLGINGGTANVNYQFADTGRTLPRRAWTHVALVRDLGAGKLRWYLNGELASETSVTIAPAVAGNQRLTLGNGWAGPFAGDLDEVRIWNSVRTGDEIRSSWKSRVTGNEPGLAAAWSFEGVAANVTRDSSTNHLPLIVGYSLSNATRPLAVESGVFEADLAQASGAAGADLSVTLAGSDADNEPLTGVILELPAQGVLYQTADGVTRGAAITNIPTAVSDAQRRVIFAAADGTNGLVTFRYTLNDTQDDAFPATAFLNILPANRAPVAANDTLAAFQDSATALSGLLANDTDADGDALKVIPATQPAHGRLSFNQNGELVYTPDPGFAGQDAFTYALVDGLSWNRELDFRPGTVNFSTQGNPSQDRLGLPSWRMDYLAGGGLSDSAPWYRQSPGRLLWDNDWYGSGGYWAYQDNFGAVAWRLGLSHNLSGGGWFDSIPA